MEFVWELGPCLDEWAISDPHITVAMLPPISITTIDYPESFTLCIFALIVDIKCEGGRHLSWPAPRGLISASVYGDIKL